MNKRKPYNNLRGYKCSRRNTVNRNHVVICDAEPQGLDGDGAGRWAVMCMVHNTLTFVTSVRLGRPLMKIPEFCEECMKDYREGETG